MWFHVQLSFFALPSLPPLPSLSPPTGAFLSAPLLPTCLKCLTGAYYLFFVTLRYWLLAWSHRLWSADWVQRSLLVYILYVNGVFFLAFPFWLFTDLILFMLMYHSHSFYIFPDLCPYCVFPTPLMHTSVISRLLSVYIYTGWMNHNDFLHYKLWIEFGLILRYAKENALSIVKLGLLYSSTETMLSSTAGYRDISECYRASHKGDLATVCYDAITATQHHVELHR
jgi:hypothetical protein